MPSIRNFLTPNSSTKGFSRLECFFCGEKRNIPQTAIENVPLEPPIGGRPLNNRQTELRRPFRQDICIPTGKKWCCPVCESVNMRDENGEIVDIFPEMRDPSLNRVIGAVRVKSNKTSQAESRTETVFCETCQLHQQLVAKLLGEFIPDESDPEYDLYIASIDSYRRDLETRYPLVCASCQIKVDEDLSRKEKTMLMARLDQVLHRSRNAVRLPAGTRSRKEGVKPIIDPVPWWKQFGWAIWGLIWVTAWVSTIVIHMQGIITSPSYCDIGQSFLPTSPVFEDMFSDGPADHSLLHAIFAVTSGLVHTTNHAASACLWERNMLSTCTCALRNAWLSVLVLSVLSVWFNPTWRSRALRGNCKPVDGWNAYKKCHWQAIVSRLCMYFAITPTAPDVLAKTIHVALLAINLMNFYDALVAIQIFGKVQLGVIRPDGLRVAGKRTSSSDREGSPKISRPALQRSPTPSPTGNLREPVTQINMHTAHPHPHPPNGPETGLAWLSLGSAGIRGHSTSSRRQGEMDWAPSSYTPKGTQNRSWTPLGHKSTDLQPPARSRSFNRPFPDPVSTTSPAFGSNIGRPLSRANSQPQLSLFESSKSKDVTSEYDDFVLGPQSFFPPEKPTGLEDLLDSFKIDDGSTLRRLQPVDTRLGRHVKVARRIIIAAFSIRIVTLLLQGWLQYFYVGFIAIALLMLGSYKGSLTSSQQRTAPHSSDKSQRHFYVTRGLYFLLSVRLIIAIGTTIMTYMRWRSVDFEDVEDDSWGEVFWWQLDMLRFPFFDFSETEIYIPLLGDLSSIAGLALDMAICFYGMFVWGTQTRERPHAA